MAFIRTNKRENPFVQIDKTFTEDDRLSWGAKGLMAYILSRPDNWKIRREDLYKRSTDGKTKVENYILDLMELGYIYYWNERDKDGTIKEWFYDVYESPEFNPYLEESVAKAKEMKQKRKAANKRKVAKRKLLIPDSEVPKVDNKPESELPEVDVPEVDNPDVAIPHYNNNDFNDIESNNTDSNNIDHHLYEGFDEKHSKLIHQFFSENQIDDDMKSKLLERLKGRNFKHLSYIKQTYETVKLAVQPSKTIRKENMPEYLKDDYKPAEQEKMSVEEIEAIKAKFAEQRKRIRKGRVI